MGTIKDKVIMITGASSGFGKITAEKCVSLGAKVILGARRKDRLEELCKQFGSENSVYEVTDVSKKETVDNLAKRGIKEFGKIDALINNAGIMPLSLLEKGRTETNEAERIKIYQAANQVMIDNAITLFITDFVGYQAISSNVSNSDTTSTQQGYGTMGRNLSFREMALKGEIPGVTKASW